jgi:hypothetical protein
MKKLMTLMLGMAIAFTVVAPTFAAQDTTKTKAPKKAKKAPKKETTKKDTKA